MDERKDAIAARFGAARDYDAAAAVQRRSASLLAARLREATGVLPPGRILEFGCGTGLLTRHLRANFPRSTLLATDLSPAMLDRARETVRGTAGGTTFRVMDGEYPDAEGPFGLIASNLCFQWFTDRRGALERLAALLEPGGVLAVTTLLEGSLSEWRDSCAAECVPCGVPDYPPAAVLEAEWPRGGAGRWEALTLRDPVPDARGFLAGLRRIGASLPREGARRADAAGLRRAMTRFDSVHDSVTYRIGLGLFRKDLS